MQEWRRFELACRDLLAATFSTGKWEVQEQVSRTYADGERRLDFHVRDRSKPGGGYRWIFECKHKPKTGLTMDDVDQAYDYKRRGRASAVTLLISSNTPVTERVGRYADDLSIDVLPIKWGRGRLRQVIRNIHNEHLLSWSTQIATSEQ